MGAEHLVGSAVRDDASSWFEEHQPVDQVEPRADPVLHDEHRRAGVVEQRPDGVVDLDDSGRVEVRARFVEHERSRTHREHPGERQSLPLPAGEHRGGPVERQVQPDDVEGGPHALPDLRSWDPGVLAAERDVVAHAGHHGVGLGVLHDEPDATADLPGGDAVDEQRAGDGGGGVVGGVGFVGQHGRDRPEERGLARTGRTDDGDAFAGLHRQVDAADRPGRAPGVPPPPVPEDDPSGSSGSTSSSARHAHAAGEVRACCTACSRPTANADSTPVLASARTMSHDPAPAITAPEIVAEMM